MPAAVSGAATTPPRGAAAVQGGATPLLPVVGFVWTESTGVGRRRIYVAGAERANWLDPATAATAFALAVRVTAGVPTSEPALRRADAANPAHAAAQQHYLGAVQAILSWLQTIGSNVTGVGGKPPTRDELLRIILRMRADQVLVGLLHGVDRLEGGVYYLIPRSALSAPAAQAFQAAQQLARTLNG